MTKNRLNLLLNKNRLENILATMSEHVTSNENLLTDMVNLSVSIVKALDLIDQLIDLETRHNMLVSDVDAMFRNQAQWDAIATLCKRIAFTSWKLRQTGVLTNMLQ